MKRSALAIALVSATLAASLASGAPASAPPVARAAMKDSAVAASAPAMLNPAMLRRYWIGFLMRGPNWTPQRNAHTDSVQAAHLANIGAMAEAGALVCAGPLLDAQPMRGIFIFTCDSAEAVRRTAGDAAIAEGRLALELHPMLALRGIGDRYREWKKAGNRLADSLRTYSFGLLKTAPRAEPHTRAELDSLRKGHLAHLVEMVGSGKLALAGPLLDGGAIAGIYVFDASLDQARALASTDPMLRAGWMTLEVRPWMTALGAMP